MYLHSRDINSSENLGLRKEAGRWLAELRQHAGLSQRDLAAKTGTDFYTFISQIENGRGRIPPNKYEVWAIALNVNPRMFVQKLLSYYDPITYHILFADFDAEK